MLFVDDFLTSGFVVSGRFHTKSKSPTHNHPQQEISCPMHIGASHLAVKKLIFIAKAIEKIDYIVYKDVCIMQ